MNAGCHQYIDRASGELREEKLFGNFWLRRLFPQHSEEPGLLYRMLVSARWPSQAIAALNFDILARFPGSQVCSVLKVDCSECLEECRTARDVFQRKIRFWDCRPMEPDERAVVSPCDSRLLVGSLGDENMVFAKGKFFDLSELVGERWEAAFRGAAFVICRLTPDKYHYNHMPVSGTVLDFVELEGSYHSCHPGIAVRLVNPYSKNRRAVTIIDTDRMGSGVGIVAMVEVAALMIGEIEQCYSSLGYDAQTSLSEGMEVKRGAVKSLFRPGSSTVILLFQRGRVEFEEDLLRNSGLPGESFFARALGRNVLETDVSVRSTIGWRT